MRNERSPLFWVVFDAYLFEFRKKVLLKTQKLYLYQELKNTPRETETVVLSCCNLRVKFCSSL